MKIKVPLQCHQSAVESAVENDDSRRSDGISAISAVETCVPPTPRTRTRDALNMKKRALMALMALAPHLTSENGSAINGTATALRGVT